MPEYERALSVLEELVLDARADPDRNEAATRLRFIDRLLQDCLGWAPDEVEPEEHLNGEYLDYVLGKPERAAVVEAKRTSVHFLLPEGVAGERHVALKTIYKASSVNQLAVNQVLGYPSAAGIAVAVLCNGHQLVVFLASRQDGVAPLAGRAIVFSSLDEMLDDFQILWNTLSKSGLRSQWAKRALSRSSALPPPPERLSSRIPGYPGFRASSELDRDVQLLADLFLQDIVHEATVSDSFLRECYCSSGALSQYASVSKGVLISRQTVITGVDTEQARSKQGDTSRLAAVVGAALQRRPLVLLGNVGVGKSIFLKHFFRVEAPDLLDRSLIFFLDFLTDVGLLTDFQGKLVSTVTESLRDQYEIDIHEAAFIKATYNKERNQFRKGLFGELRETDPVEYAKQERIMLLEHSQKQQEHLRRSLEHLRGTRRLDFVLVVDNVDHHTRDDQEKIFILSESLASTWPFAVFLSLRPDTFYESRRAGALAAYQPRVFTVEPPRTDLVIAKRLKFAQAQLEETGRLGTFPTGLQIDSSSLLAYIDVLIEGFDRNEALKEMVDNLASGNIRQALDFLSRFVGSGYFGTARVLEVADRGEIYTLPVHEFLRAIIFGPYAHYMPASSTIVNLFDVSTNDAREHFLLSMLLASCESRGEATPHGFVEEVRLYEEFQALGFVLQQIEAQLERAHSRGLLEASGDDPAMRSLRITTAGAYMYKKLLHNFTYVDAMVDDTPVVDVDFRSRVQLARTLPERLERATLFADYLDSSWPFEQGATTFHWPDASGVLRRDLTLTAERAARNAARSGSRRA